MTVYVAMLRGINVGGQKIIRMEKLRASFETLGFQKVRTYVQSGNVVFEATKALSDNLSRIIGEKILGDFGFAVPLLLRTAEEMKKIVGGNPFLNEKRIDRSKLHVTFLSELPSKAGLEKLDLLNALPDQFRVRGGEVYLHCPNGYGKTKLSNTALEKLLAVRATTRNWNTVKTLTDMTSE